MDGAGRAVDAAGDDAARMVGGAGPSSRPPARHPTAGPAERRYFTTVLTCPPAGGTFGRARQDLRLTLPGTRGGRV